jgi:hypothetical protein
MNEPKKKRKRRVVHPSDAFKPNRKFRIKARLAAAKAKRTPKPATPKEPNQ